MGVAMLHVLVVEAKSPAETNKQTLETNKQTNKQTNERTNERTTRRECWEPIITQIPTGPTRWQTSMSVI